MRDFREAVKNAPTTIEDRLSQPHAPHAAVPVFGEVHQLGLVGAEADEAGDGALARHHLLRHEPLLHETAPKASCRDGGEDEQGDVEGRVAEYVEVVWGEPFNCIVRANMRDNNENTKMSHTTQTLASLVIGSCEGVRVRRQGLVHLRGGVQQRIHPLAGQKVHVLPHERDQHLVLDKAVRRTVIHIRGPLHGHNAVDVFYIDSGHGPEDDLQRVHDLVRYHVHVCADEEDGLQLRDDTGELGQEGHRVRRRGQGAGGVRVGGRQVRGHLREPQRRPGQGDLHQPDEGDCQLQARQYPRVPGDDQELDGGRRRVGLLERVPDHIRLLVQHVVLHRGHQDPSVAGRAGFSASTYLEPIMYSDSITGMKMAMGVMLWLNWESDADSRDIMKGRAIDLEDVSNKTFEVMGDGFPSLSIAVVAITATFTAGYLTMTLVEDGLGFGQSQ
ncbi:hypothetical protein HBI24_207150 [Parastagonospora nodorum]|nr:hypothetical protein HBI24_207150 [Parastagonospora nodorum]